MVNSTVLDRTFAALADPSRRAIVATLAIGPRTVGELAAPLPMSLVAASKHIGVLEKAGLVSRTRNGRTQVCRLDAGVLRDATDWLDTYRSFWTARLDALDRFVTEPAGARSARVDPGRQTRRLPSSLRSSVQAAPAQGRDSGAHPGSAADGVV